LAVSSDRIPALSGSESADGPGYERSQGRDEVPTVFHWKG
jgi:hypothetical protein